VSALGPADLPTMLNINKSRNKEKYLAAVFCKGFFGGRKLALHRGESGASGDC
jgi:hypothetical protein